MVGREEIIVASFGPAGGVGPADPDVDVQTAPPTVVANYDGPGRFRPFMENVPVQHLLFSFSKPRPIYSGATTHLGYQDYPGSHATHN